MYVDPVIFSLGPISVRWYSLAYIICTIFSYWYMHKLDYKNMFIRSFSESLLTYSIVGLILGGRIGYVLIYDPSFYMSHPIDIFKTWEGGMSFHGGAIGLLVSVFILCKKYSIHVLYMLDILSCCVPVGLLLGRIGNFINGELFGKVTSMPWGMIFHESGDGLLRHPSQLYEAFFEGLVLFIITNLLFLFTKIRLRTGLITGIAVIWYSISRFFIEFFREPDYQIGYLWLDLTMGQLLSIPMILVGVVLIYLRMFNPESLIRNDVPKK